MITKVTVQNFKRFKEPTEFVLDPDGVTFLAGGNNSGKSTLLQALAIWDFSRTVVETEKGRRALIGTYSGDGVGISSDEFSPMSLPTFNHLWSNLKPREGNSRGQPNAAFTLRIGCKWDEPGEEGLPQERGIEFGLRLAHDRVYVKPLQSTITAGSVIPQCAYLPPFAGIGPREEKMIPAIRKRWIGRGLAGAVLRNLLYDFWKQNCDAREKARGPRGRISAGSLSALRKTDPWEQLLMVIEEVFKTGLSVSRFEELYHMKIEVAAWEGQLVNKQFVKKSGSPVTDLMVEGSGFLQWLSVFALALNKELDVLLLDEPDAHLHPALQGHLIQKLSQLARENNKQVLLATHSTTILSETKTNRIFRMEERSYLKDERGRVSLFVGLGSQYAPRLDQLKRCKRLFLHDGPSDLEILQAWAKTLGLAWPENLVCWKSTKEHEPRELLFEGLRAEIPGLRAISLQDRDDFRFTETEVDLTFGSHQLFRDGLGLRRWRRRNIENYLLHPVAIARAAGVTELEVRTLLSDPHGLSIPTDFTSSDCAQTLANTDGKEIITKNIRSVTAEFRISYLQIAEAMRQDEIPDDPKVLLQQLVDLCRT